MELTIFFEREAQARNSLWFRRQSERRREVEPSTGTGNEKLWESLPYCISQFQLRPAPPPELLRGICPPCQSRGWSICKFCTARGPGICQPPGPFPSFWHAEYNYVHRWFYWKKADWLTCQGQEQIVEGCKGMFSILHVCTHFFIAYQARIT